MYIIFYSVNKADDGTSNFLIIFFEYKRCLNRGFYFLLFLYFHVKGEDQNAVHVFS